MKSPPDWDTDSRPILLYSTAIRIFPDLNLLPFSTIPLDKIHKFAKIQFDIHRINSTEVKHAKTT